MLLRIDDKGRLWLTLQLRRVSNASKDLPTRKAVDHE